MPQERRLAAILSADVAGYSRLMSEDEQGTIQTLTAYRSLISSLVGDHHGRVVDSPGDNLLAEFPNALDAVQCAVEVQGVLRVRNQSLAENRQMLFRIGVHLADITAEGERIYGDGVNIAARLEGLAEPGGVCISGAVHEQVRGKLEIGYVDLGEQEVKNIPDPVRVFRVLPGREKQWVATRASKRLGARRLALLALPVAVLVGLGVWWWGWRAEEQQPSRGVEAAGTPTIEYVRTVDDIRIATLSEGDGWPPRIVLPAWVGSLQLRQRAAPPPPGIRIIRFDKRGTGLSDRNLKDYSLEARARDIDAVVEHFHLDQFVLYGLSEGGPLAIWYAAKYPERIIKLILIGTFSHGDLLPEDVHRAIYDLVRAEWGIGAEALDNLFQPGASLEESARFVQGQREGATRDDAASMWQAMSAIDVRELLPLIHCPVLVIHARGDRVVPFALGEELARELPNARLLPVESDRHLIAGENLALVFRAIEDFLAEDPESGSDEHRRSDAD